jgi:hypothetical protein
MRRVVAPQPQRRPGSACGPAPTSASQRLGKRL